jgi:hypothetical protein
VSGIYAPGYIARARRTKAAVEQLERQIVATTSLPVSSWRFHLNRRFALMSYRLATTDTKAPRRPRLLDDLLLLFGRPPAPTRTIHRSRPTDFGVHQFSWWTPSSQDLSLYPPPSITNRRFTPDAYDRGVPGVGTTAASGGARDPPGGPGAGARGRSPVARPAAPQFGPGLPQQGRAPAGGAG